MYPPSILLTATVRALLGSCHRVRRRRSAAAVCVRATAAALTNRRNRSRGTIVVLRPICIAPATILFSERSICYVSPIHPIDGDGASASR